MPWCDPSRPMPLSLTAAERRDLGGGDALVDADDAVLQGLGYAPAAAEIARVKVGGQAERRIVGHAHRFLLRLEAEQGRHRPERLLAAKPSFAA